LIPQAAMKKQAGFSRKTPVVFLHLLTNRECDVLLDNSRVSSFLFDSMPSTQVAIATTHVVVKASLTIHFSCKCNTVTRHVEGVFVISF